MAWDAAAAMPPAGAWVDTIDYSFANSPAVQAFDWIGSIVFFASAVLLGSKLYTFKPEVLNLFALGTDMSSLTRPASS